MSVGLLRQPNAQLSTFVPVTQTGKGWPKVPQPRQELLKSLVGIKETMKVFTAGENILVSSGKRPTNFGVKI